MSDLCNTLENHHLMPLSVAVNTACVEQLLEDKITESSTRLEQLLEDKLKELLESMHPDCGRIRCTEHLNLYVSPTGDDANTGLSQEQAFATVNRAVQRLNDFDVAGYEATINLAAGNYAEDVQIGAAATGCGAGQLTLLGESGAAVSTITVDSCAIPVLVKNMLLKPSGATTVALRVINFSRVTVEGMNVQPAGAINVGISASFYGQVVVNSAEFSGTYNDVFHANKCSSIRLAKSPVKFNAVRCNYSTIYSGFNSIVVFEAPQLSGSVTGTKYRVGSSSVLYTDGIAVPGSVAGTVSSGGQVV